MSAAMLTESGQPSVESIEALSGKGARLHASHRRPD
jgi:hypothetical protein